MKFKRLIVFAVVLIVLAVLVFITQNLGDEETQDSTRIFPAFKTDKAFHIQTKKESKETLLEKKDGTWLVVNQGNYPAGQNMVNDLLKKIEELPLNRIASRQAEKHSKFEVDAEAGLEVKISDKNKKTLAHFYLGKQGPDYTSNYLRKEGSKEVMECGENISYLFNRPDWREHQLFKPKVEDVKNLTVSYPNEIIILNQNAEKEWQLAAPQAGKAQKEEVTKLFTNLTSIRIAQFVEETPPEEETGLNEPTLKISWQLEGGKEGAFILGKKKGGLRYAQQEGISAPVLIPDGRLQPLFEQADKLKQPQPESAKEAPPKKEEKEKTQKEETTKSEQ